LPAALVSCTARATVSLGTRPDAPMVSRLVAVPAAPSAIATVPLASGWAALVLEVNEPNVPRPATAPVSPLTPCWALATKSPSRSTLAQVLIISTWLLHRAASERAQ